MTLAHGTDWLESDRLVLRRVTPDDLPFYTRLHALPKVVEHLYPEGRPHSPEETKAWMEYMLASYELGGRGDGEDSPATFCARRVCPATRKRPLNSLSSGAL